MHVRKSLNRFFSSLRRKTKEGKVDDHVVDTLESRNQIPHADVNQDTSSKRDCDHFNDENDSDDSSENMKGGYTKWKPMGKRKSHLKKQNGKENEWNAQQQEKQRNLNHQHNNLSSTTRFSFMKKKEQSLSSCQLFETGIENEESDNSDFDYEIPTQQQCNEYICSKKKTKRKSKTKREKPRITNILHVKADICADPIPSNKHGETDQKYYDNEEFSIDSENITRNTTAITTNRIMTNGEQLVEKINFSPGKPLETFTNREKQTQKNETIQQQQLFFEKEMDAILASSSSSSSSSPLPCRCNGNAAEGVSIHKNIPSSSDHLSHQAKNTTVSLFSKKQIVLLSMQKSAKRMKKALKEGFIAWGESISYASAVMPQIYTTDYPAMASNNQDDDYYCYATSYQPKPNSSSNQNGYSKRETQQLQQQRHQQLYTQQAAHSSMATNYALQCNHSNHHSQLAY